MHNGYLKLYRKIASNPLWTKKPFSDGQAWVDMLLIANHKPGVIDKRGNRVKVERGQVGYSVLGLADRWGWSRGKVDRFLKYLENEQQIEQQKSSVTTLITILNYEEYNGNGQQDEQQTDNRRTADEQQTDINKNEKKGKNEKNNLCERDFILNQFKKTFQKPMSNTDFQKIPYLMRFDQDKVEKAFTAAEGKKSLNYVISILENEPTPKPVNKNRTGLLRKNGVK